MNAEHIRELIDKEPFEPFRIRTSSGAAYEVRSPHSVALMKSRVFIALPDDSSAIVPFLHISSIENIRNGHSPRRGRRAK
jgi:hypothetical protein